ncbi:MAG: SRPBCC domain-containing protein [Myxococcota bacterium]
MEDIEVTGVVPAPPARVYAAFLDGEAHGEMTGATATSDPRVGGAFTAWDGYIEGKHLELDPPRRIVQAWRSSEFPKKAPDSRLEIRLEPHPEGTRVTFVHTGIPDGQGASYRQGWEDYYLEPMRAHFGG